MFIFDSLYGILFKNLQQILIVCLQSQQSAPSPEGWGPFLKASMVYPPRGRKNLQGVIDVAARQGDVL